MCDPYHPNPHCCPGCYERYMRPAGYTDPYIQHLIRKEVHHQVSEALRYQSVPQVRCVAIDPAFEKEYLGEWVTKPARKQLKSGEKEVNIVQKIKSLTLSADDKLLRKHGLMDSEGDLTSDGEDVLSQILLDEYKPKLVAKVKEAVKEDK